MSPSPQRPALLRLRLVPGAGMVAEPRDLEAQVQPGALVGDLADALAALSGAPAGRTIAVPGRGVVLDRAQPLVEADLRAGDEAALTTEPARAAAPAELRVLTGPDAGRCFGLAPGVNTVGRGPGNDVELRDPWASRRHLRLTVSDRLEAADLGSANGVMVGGAALSAAAELAHRTRLVIGRSTVEVAWVDRAGARGAPFRVGVHRPPRLGAPPSPSRVELPEPPDAPARRRLPVLTALAPLVIGAAMFALTRRVASAAFFALSPVVVLAAALEGRRGERAQHRRRLARHRAEVAAAEQAHEALQQAEAAALAAASPRLGELIDSAARLGPRLWERRRGDGDFLRLRVGLGAAASQCGLEAPRRGDPALLAELVAMVERRRLVTAPVTIDLAEIGVLALCGADDACRELAAALVAQAAALHSPDDLAVYAALGPTPRAAWGWLKWLPHVTPLARARAAAPECGDDALLGELCERLERHGRGGPRALVVLDEGAGLSPALRRRVIELAEAGRCSAIALAAGVEHAPGAARAVISVPAPSGAAGTAELVVAGQAPRTVEQVETLSPSDADRLGRRLAGLVDAGAGAPPATLEGIALATLLGSPELLGDVESAQARWAQWDGSLRGVLGAASAGLLTVDLRADGPHALIGGTTGSGKSELLAGLVASLAWGQPPERVTFLLVDYKGGAAFRDCVRLPHTVGLVTDLTPHLAQRALVSLEAEVERRERLLERAGVAELAALERAGEAAPPSLVIVVDEFAALAKEAPTFVQGLVDIAQRGRSLGLHLVLATQRPAGVVTEAIRANTNLRVVLRVGAERDSLDVIDAPHGAAIERGTPGRGYARIGPRELIEFQAGAVGACSVARRPVELRPLELGHTAPEPADETEAAPASAPTDLAVLVATLQAAHAAGGRPEPRRPWLEPLPAELELEQLPRSGGGRVVFGLLDEPRRQRRRTAELDLARDANALVLGGAGAGKTTLLRTLAVSAARGDEAVQVYAIDAGGGLAALAALPSVGAVIPLEDEERVGRILARLERELQTRQGLLATHHAGDLAELHRLDDAAPPRLLLLIDGARRFVEHYERVDGGRQVERLVRLAGAGRAGGVHVVMAAESRAGIPAALASCAQARVLLRPAPGDEAALTERTAAALFAGVAPPGRGLFEGAELQIGVYGGAAPGAEAQAVAGLAAELERAGAVRAPTVGRLPCRLTLADVAAADPGEPAGGERLVIGVDGETLGPAVLPLDEGPVCVFGPPRSGRSSTLAAVAQALVRGGVAAELHLLAARRSWLTAAPCWRSAAVGAEAAAAAEHLVALARTRAAKDPCLVVLVDDVCELDDRRLDAALLELAALGRELPVRLVVSAEAGAARRSYGGALAALRAAGVGLLLCPDPDRDGDLLGVRLPRGAGGPRVPGRGQLVVRGRVGLVQAAAPTPG